MCQNERDQLSLANSLEDDFDYMLPIAQYDELVLFRDVKVALLEEERQRIKDAKELELKLKEIQDIKDKKRLKEDPTLQAQAEKAEDVIPEDETGPDEREATDVRHEGLDRGPEAEDGRDVSVFDRSVLKSMNKEKFIQLFIQHNDFYKCLPEARMQHLENEHISKSMFETALRAQSPALLVLAEKYKGIVGSPISDTEYKEYTDFKNRISKTPSMSRLTRTAVRVQSGADQDQGVYRPVLRRHRP